MILCDYYSLMGSFVPFGGFFSSTSDFRVPLSNQTLPRCHLCNEKYEQEVATFAKSGPSQCSEKLPSWLRNVEIEQDKGTLIKAKDDPNATIQKKWDEICQRIHQTPAFPKLSFQPVRPQFPLQFVEDHSRKISLGRPTDQSIHISTSERMGKPQNPPHQPGGLSVKISEPEDLTSRTTNSPLSCVTIDLGLGTIYASKNQNSSTPVSLNRMIKEKPLFSTSRYYKDFKSLRELLSRKVGFQDEAVTAISEILCGYADTSRRTTTSSLCLALLGPDKVGKKKVASALAEIFFGCQENCISVDFQGHHESLDDRFRGKTIVDYIANEVAKRVNSVVFIENIKKAEFLDQMRLSEALKTGKLRDSHGREISLNNVIVLATTSTIDKESGKYSEEKVFAAKNRKLLIKLTDNVVNKNGLNKRRQEEIETEVTELRAVKSQRSFLDLNLPVEETESNLDSTSENTEAWIEDFVEKVDGKVKFKEIDFDGLAKNIKRKIFSQFHRSFGSETELEIEHDVIIQILAALRWSLDEERPFDQWLETVLGLSFVEARQKYVNVTSFGLKLVVSRDSPVEEETVGIRFPARVEVI